MPLPPTPKVQTPWLLKPQRYGLTLANGVTAIRLVLVPFIAAALLNQRFDDAFWLTLLAGASDAVDGFIARYFGHKSIVGAYLDPAADKILIITLFGLLTYADHLPLWLMVLVLARDASIVVGVAVFSVPMHGGVIPKHTGVAAAEGVELGRFVLRDSVPGNGETAES